MKDFLKKLVSFVTDQPEKITIDEKIEDGLTIYTIFAPEEEVGKIIGKGGKVINALRTLCRLKATKEQQRIVIKVEALQMENGLSRPIAEGEETGSGTGTPA
ncbi:MAG TPA: KH domain-containing protein [Patescibacteria group bacterium]|nr:KH domain-containing protein [Patescibacteria group bacterium]